MRSLGRGAFITARQPSTVLPAEEQRILLEAEGIEFDSRGFIDWQRFGWEGLSAVEVEALVNCEC